MYKVAETLYPNDAIGVFEDSPFWFYNDNSHNAPFCKDTTSPYKSNAGCEAIDDIEG